MSHEHKGHRRRNISTGRYLMNITALLLTIAVVGKPFLERENTDLALQALAGNQIQCANGVDTLDQRYPYDAIVVPGAGLIEKSKGVFVPSSFGEMRLEGAAIAYERELAPTIILLEGKMNPGEELVDTRYIQKIYKGLTGKTVPDNQIIVETESINTATNMEKLRKILTDYGLKKVVIVTNEFHEPRSILFACKRGIAAYPLSAEDLIVSQNSMSTQAIRIINESPGNKDIKRKEALEILLAIWDTEGWVPTFIRSLEK